LFWVKNVKKFILRHFCAITTTTYINNHDKVYGHAYLRFLWYKNEGRQDREESTEWRHICVYICIPGWPDWAFFAYLPSD
jgi:hypothetical protein